MPFVKYYGRIQPLRIGDQVQYEDPEGPSFKGHNEARVRVWTRCEDQGIPRDQWDETFRAHVRSEPYEGMSHVGGIGRIAQVDPGSPYLSELAPAEYEELKRVISQANTEYKERVARRLAIANDPGRRALPEDEALGWRTRVWIASHTELAHHLPYRIDDSCRAYARARQCLSNGMTLQLIDLYHRSSGEPMQVAFDGLERAERCVDLLAVAGFGPAFLAQAIGTSPPFCREGIAFKLVTLQARIIHSAVVVEPEVFEMARVHDDAHAPLRHVREGLSASLPTAAFASFWNALERRADIEARKAGLKRTVRCKKCGHERHAGWNIKDAFRAMYKKARVGGDFDRHRSIRGRVQHGDAFFSQQSPTEFMPEVSQLQQTAMASVSETIGLRPQAAEYLLTGIPAVVFDCVPDGGGFKIDVDRFSVGSAASILPMRASANKGRRFEAGVDLPPKVDPLAFPPVVTDESGQFVGWTPGMQL